MSTNRRGALAALEHREFRRYAYGALASLLGDGAFRVSIAALVLSISGNDPAALALVALTVSVSQAVFLPLGGWTGDRFRRRDVVLVSDLWRGTAMAAVAALALSGTLTVGRLVVLIAAYGAGNAFFNPVVVALVPELVPSSGLARANAFMGGARPVMLYMLGPLIGAGLIGLVGTGGAIAFNAATFVVSAAFLATIRARPKPAAAGSGDDAPGPLAQALAGFKVVLGMRWLALAMLGTALGTLAYHGPFDVLLPSLLAIDFGLDERGIASVLAPLFTASAVGALVTSAVLGRRDLPRRFLLGFYVAEALGIVVMLGFAVMRAPWQAVPVGLVVGGCLAYTEVVFATALQRLVPNEALGRVSSVDWMLSIGIAPLSFALAGPLGAAFGPRPVVAAFAALGTVAILALLAVPGVRSPEGSAAARGDEGERGEVADAVADPVAGEPVAGAQGRQPSTVAGRDHLSGGGDEDRG